MTATISRRYYKVVGGDLGSAMQAQLVNQQGYIARLEAVARSLGAVKVHTFKETGKFAGFEFPETMKVDTALFIKRPDNVWLPKRREFASFYKAIEKDGGGSVPQDVLKQFGLKTKDWLTMPGHEFKCKVVGFYSLSLWWVEVPYRHFDAETLEIARKAKAEGVTGTEPINMLWEPPSDWQQVTLGQYLDEWDLHYQQEIQLAQEPKQ